MIYVNYMIYKKLHTPISSTMPSDNTSFVKFVNCPFKFDKLGSPSPNHAILHVDTYRWMYFLRTIRTIFFEVIRTAYFGKTIYLNGIKISKHELTGTTHVVTFTKYTSLVANIVDNFI